MILYPALMLVLATAFLVVFCNKKSADVTILQGLGLPYSETAPGEITNQVQVIIENRSGRDAVYKIEIAGNAQAHFARPPEAISLPAGKAVKTPLAIVVPAAVFERGLCNIQLRVSDDKTFQQEVACRLLGPLRRAAAIPRGVRNERKHTMNDTPTPSTVEKPPRHLLWPILLTSLISIHVVSVVVMVFVATHDNSFAIEPDWYLKGLNYEQTAQQQRENSRLGLVGPTRRRPTADRHEPAQRDLHGPRPHGPARKNATVDLVAFAHLRANNARGAFCCRARAKNTAPRLAFADPGIWEFRLVITRGPETFTQIVKREI